VESSVLFTRKQVLVLGQPLVLRVLAYPLVGPLVEPPVLAQLRVRPR
jgi:hypothetical protein